MAQPQSILRLKDECFRELFGYLTLRDLCSLSKTCKQLEKLCSEYFGENYRSKSIEIEMQNDRVIQKLDGIDTTFARNAYEVRIFDEHDKLFEYVAENVNPNLKSIQFVMLTTTHAELIKNILANVEVVKLIFCLVDGGSYDNLLKYCLNLKCLSIADSQDSRVQWPRKTYPTLEDLIVLDNSDGPFDGLKNFLKMNPQIKTFRTSINRTKLFQLMEDAGVKLDELAFEVHDFDQSKAEATRHRLNSLYIQGCFKRVKISYYKGNNLVDFIGVVQKIQGLYAVEFVHCLYHGNLHSEMSTVANALASLHNIVELCFQQCEISLDQADILSKRLVHLERLFLVRNSIEISLPFARRLQNLNMIRIGEDSIPSDFDIESLHIQRKQLRKPVKLIVFLPEEAFILLKWRTNCVIYELVEIKHDGHMHPIK